MGAAAPAPGVPPAAANGVDWPDPPSVAAALLADEGRTVKKKGVELPEVLIEIRRVGHAVQVNAIDPATGVEVSVVGDPKEGEEALKRTAARKLACVLAKRRREEGGGP